MTQPVAILSYSAHTNEWFAYDAQGYIIARDRLRSEVIKMCRAAGYRVIETK